MELREIVARANAEALGYAWDSLPAKRWGSHLGKEECLSVAHAVFAALNAAGYAVVPKEPTERMLDAGDNLIPITRSTIMASLNSEAIWRAMVAAAQEGGE